MTAVPRPRKAELKPARLAACPNSLTGVGEVQGESVEITPDYRSDSRSEIIFNDVLGWDSQFSYVYPVGTTLWQYIVERTLDSFDLYKRRVPVDDLRFGDFDFDDTTWIDLEKNKFTWIPHSEVLSIVGEAYCSRELRYWPDSFKVLRLANSDQFFSTKYASRRWGPNLHIRFASGDECRDDGCRYEAKRIYRTVDGKYLSVVTSFDHTTNQEWTAKLVDPIEAAQWILQCGWLLGAELHELVEANTLGRPKDSVSNEGANNDQQTEVGEVAYEFSAEGETACNRERLTVSLLDLVELTDKRVRESTISKRRSSPKNGRAAPKVVAKRGHQSLYDYEECLRWWPTQEFVADLPNIEAARTRLSE